VPELWLSTPYNGLKCPDCGTAITGDFPMDELFKLTPEQLDFVKLFLKKRGNLSEVRKNWVYLTPQLEIA